jgi:hypothetical protein
LNAHINTTTSDPFAMRRALGDLRPGWRPTGNLLPIRRLSACHQPEEPPMAIFGDIMSAIFRHGSAASAAPASPAASGGQAPARQTAPASPASGAASAAPTAAASGQTVDVEAVLNDLAKKKKEKLNWRTSIVDLMKLLDLDSGLGARKQLAQELHYSGDTNDSAAMNVWLHKQVMQKLAENGGKVPADLRH